MDDRFTLLTSHSRGAVPRHQTLRATIAWSFNLLTDPERDLLAQLSVFVGGFTAEATEAIFDHANTFDLLSGLVDKSLVMVVMTEDTARYRILETIRQYAAEMLAQDDATRATVTSISSCIWQSKQNRGCRARIGNPGWIG